MTNRNVLIKLRKTPSATSGGLCALCTFFTTQIPSSSVRMPSTSSLSSTRKIPSTSMIRKSSPMSGGWDSSPTKATCSRWLPTSSMSSKKSKRKPAKFRPSRPSRKKKKNKKNKKNKISDLFRSFRYLPAFIYQPPQFQSAPQSKIKLPYYQTLNPPLNPIPHR